MRFGCIASGSDGNCYYLKDSDGNLLLLDVGIPIELIKLGIGFNVNKICGAVASHVHFDHSISLSKLRNMGIPVYAPYESQDSMAFRNGSNFRVKSFPLTDLDNHFVHTNGDGSECPCYGFMISHEELGRMVYITDAELVKWRFTGIKHLLLGVNYDGDLLDDNHVKRKHVLGGHMSLETAKEFVRVTAENNDLATVILCHLSESADEEHFVKEIESVAQCQVYVARPGLRIDLRADGCPF